MTQEKILVYVNDQPKELFFGMTVKHALGTQLTQRVRAHRAVVRDGAGNVADVDGALSDGARLYVTPIDPQTFMDDLLRGS